MDRTLIHQIIAERPEAAQRLFDKYRIKSPLDENSLAQALLVYREPFAMELFHEVYGHNMQGSTNEVKKTFFNKLMDGVALVSGAAQALSNNASNVVQTDTEMAPPKNDKGSSNAIWWIGGALLALGSLIGLLYLLKHLKGNNGK